MLKLFILRHAQATGSYDVNDHQRPLTLHGIEQASSLAPKLPAMGVAICSSANRTKMTLESIEKAGATVQKTIHSDDIYNGSAGDLLAAIQGCDKEETLLIVAHNPGVHQLANMLSSDEGSKNREHLRYNYSPATLSVLECPIESWRNLKSEENKLVDLVIPD